MMKNMINKLPLIGLMLMLNACASLLPEAPPPPSNYVLRAPTIEAQASARLPATLEIFVKDAAAGLSSPRIALRVGRNQMDYFAGAVWASPLPEMLQPIIATSFERNASLRAVTEGSGAVNADYTLLVDIRDFQAEYEKLGTKPGIHITLATKLVDNKTTKILSSNHYELMGETKSNTVKEVVAAFDTTLGDMLQHMVEEETNTLRPNKRPL